MKNSDYYPIQAPFLLSENFKRNVAYSETVYPEYSDFAICFWELEPKTIPNIAVGNVIVPDACIDLAVNPNTPAVCFAGMKKTEFNFLLPAGSSSFGFRLKPGAFFQLTGKSAALAMDSFVPLSAIDSSFADNRFFNLPIIAQKAELKMYLRKLSANKTSSDFMKLFDSLHRAQQDYASANASANDLCALLGYSQKQCERLFLKNYGLAPKAVLSILRFQNALRVLTSDMVKPSDVLRIQGYYDQPHFIRDVKQTIGLTPLELIRICREDVDFIQSKAAPS
ncbi:MAG: helix-turn-helix domain-containing protein [Clostridiales bacterium]|jgi:methylphosphotriester-DNA--protein-cysteine methyltransferase|nr:helix-turn-helix domain-containing protein [Clostridiales bacterium]